MKHYHPSFEDFLVLAKRGNTIPVYRELLADALTPVLAYQRLAEPADGQRVTNAFLLESVVGGETIARFSFIAADPEATFTAWGDQITICRGESEETITSGDPLAELAGMLHGHDPVHLPNLPRFTGGVVGYAAYDMVRYYEDFGEGPDDDRGLPDMAFGLYRTMVIFDHVSKTVKVVSNAQVADDPGAAYSQATKAVESTIARIRAGDSHSVAEINLVGLPQKPYSSNFTREQFMAAVEG